jgi:nucleoid-associated protein YgaU
MDNALQALVKSAAGTGGPTNPSSRYLNAPVETLASPSGPPVVYLGRRIIPQTSIYTSTREYVIVDGDRLDNLAFRFLGDPLLFWMICDANGVTNPEELTSQIGKIIQIPQASTIPSGARNG